MIHPARSIPYRDLVDGLQAAKAMKLVSEQVSGPLRLYCYTQTCTYDRAWNEITRLARGLILDTKRECVVATPFEKFFNLGEGDQTIPDLAFETFEKLDGSLIIIWHDSRSGWRCATKGSFQSEQAQAASGWLSCRDLWDLRKGTTYLAEYIAPSNRIVVPYEREELVLLAAYDEDGLDESYHLLQGTADRLGWRLAARHPFTSISDLIAHTAKLPATEEGFVLRFSNGLRLKIKGEEYRRIHAMISRCTPLAMWEAMLAGDDLAAIRQQLPEEFWTDFDGITSQLQARIETLSSAVGDAARSVADWPDKEVGLHLPHWPEPVRHFVFAHRKNNGDLMSGKTRQALFRTIRPTGNRLEGYTPSYAMNRIAEESL